MFLLLYSVQLYFTDEKWIEGKRHSKFSEALKIYEVDQKRILYAQLVCSLKQCSMKNPAKFVWIMLWTCSIHKTFQTKIEWKSCIKKHSLFSEDGITILCWISRALCTVFFDKFINFLAWLENFSDKRLAACTVRSTETSLSAAWNRVSKWSRGLCHPSFAKWGEIDSEVAFDSHRINLIPLSSDMDSSALSSSSSKSGLSHSCKWYLTF